MATYAETIWEKAGNPRVVLPDEEKLRRAAWEREKEVALAALDSAAMKVTNTVEVEGKTPEEVLWDAVGALRALAEQVRRMPCPD